MDETAKLIKEEGANSIAAMFVEPVQGAGGVIVPPEGYLADLRQLCRDNVILFVADEVITGFGRVGDWFASNLWDLDPDILCLAKGVTSGYLPLGATMLSDEVVDVLNSGGMIPHGFTYSGHPIPCAAALANIEILERESIPTRVRNETGPYFMGQLESLRDHPAVAEVRGVGMMAAIELLPRGGRDELDPSLMLGLKLSNIARANGVFVRGIYNMVVIAPPLVISKEEEF